MEKTPYEQYVQPKDNLNNFYNNFNAFLQTRNPDNLELELVESKKLIKFKIKGSKQPIFTLRLLSNVNPQKIHILVSEKVLRYLKRAVKDSTHILFSYRELSSVDTKYLVFLVRNVDALKKIKGVQKSGPNINISQARIEQARSALANGHKMYPQDFDSERYVITNFAHLVDVLKDLQAYNDNLASTPKPSSNTTSSENTDVVSENSSEDSSEDFPEDFTEDFPEDFTEDFAEDFTEDSTEDFTEDSTEDSTENSLEKSNSQGSQLGLEGSEELVELVRKEEYLKPFKACCEELNLSTNEHPITVDFKKNQEDDFSLIINSSSPQAVLDKEKFKTFLTKTVTDNLKVELLHTLEFLNNLKLPQDSSCLFDYADCDLSPEDKTSLQNLQILGCELLDVSAVTNMSKMFHDTKVTDLDVSNWNVANVTNMASMFEGAVQANPDVSKWNVANVTDMSRMFWEAQHADPDVSKWSLNPAVETSNFSHLESIYKRVLPKPDEAPKGKFLVGGLIVLVIIIVLFLIFR